MNACYFPRPTAIGKRMRIDVIESIADLDAARTDWDRVYMSDPDARYFLSWTWLQVYLRNRKRWFILALREKQPGSPYVAFFPLRLRTTQDPKTGIFTDDIFMAGNHAADYTGFISEPAYEAHAIRGFALFLKSQNWTNLHLDNFSGSIERRNGLLAELNGPDVVFRKVPRLDEAGLDMAICPVANLPHSWDAYLERNLSSQTRQKLRRFLRQVDNDADYRITVATADTIERDVDILFRLWRAKWGSLKGDRTDKIIETSRGILLEAFRNGSLAIPVLWHGDRPLGALANFLDHQKKSVLFYIAGRDEEWKTPSPGLVLHGHSIRRAIEEGFTSYDFLRGNEPYKYAFGVEERPLHCIAVRSRSGRNLREGLNIRSIGHVYEQGSQLYASGDRANAEAAFEQVLAAYPDHLGAQFSLAQLMFDKGKLVEAEAAYRAILAKVADPVPVLVRLGDTQLALKKFGEAAATFSTIIDQRPNSLRSHFKKGTALAASGRTAEAIKAFKALEQLHSDDPQLTTYRQKAKDALAKLLRPLSLDLNLPVIHPKGFPLKPVARASGPIAREMKPCGTLVDALKDWESLQAPSTELPFPRSVGLKSFRTKH
jgi:CelD/BcsL family acetyltransferase involved in cellulose biosynthesis/predicted negative regulator of RcsB-dependent stress response